MIDWTNLGFNALWIVGLAIILAAVSYHAWLAGEASQRLRDALSLPSWKVPVSAGALLACVGFGLGLAERPWERVVWTVLSLVCAGQFAACIRPGRQKADS